MSKLKYFSGPAAMPELHGFTSQAGFKEFTGPDRCAKRWPDLKNESVTSEHELWTGLLYCIDNHYDQASFFEGDPDWFELEWRKGEGGLRRRKPEGHYGWVAIWTFEDGGMEAVTFGTHKCFASAEARVYAALRLTVDPQVLAVAQPGFEVHHAGTSFKAIVDLFLKAEKMELAHLSKHLVDANDLGHGKVLAEPFRSRFYRLHAEHFTPQLLRPQDHKELHRAAN